MHAIIIITSLPQSVVPGAGLGSENLDVTSGGLAFITSGNAFVTLSQGYLDFVARNNIKGRVLIYDFTRPQEGAHALTIVASDGFDLDVFRSAFVHTNNYYNT